MTRRAAGSCLRRDSCPLGMADKKFHARCEIYDNSMQSEDKSVREVSDDLVCHIKWDL